MTATLLTASEKLEQMPEYMRDSDVERELLDEIETYNRRQQLASELEKLRDEEKKLPALRATRDQKLAAVEKAVANLERARTEWLRALGIDQDILLEEENIVFAVVSADLKFRKPARFNDELEVTAEVTGLKRASMEFEQRIWRPETGDELLCEGHIRAAALDASSMKPRSMPQSLMTELSRWTQ